MSNKTYCVYSHTNKINGKVYIGLTSMKPEERWANGKHYHNGTHFRNAIDKYGWDNFEHKIIEDGLTKEEAADLEIYYISLYNSTDRRYGYNMSSGGENGGGHPQTEEARKKIGQNGCHTGMVGKKLSKEHKKKLLDSITGKPRSEETKRKISEAHRKIRNRKVYCVELDRVFESLDEASDFLERSKASIVECCKRKNGTCAGYHLVYAN